jgi:hypothetical protein
MSSLGQSLVQLFVALGDAIHAAYYYVLYLPIFNALIALDEAVHASSNTSSPAPFRQRTSRPTRDSCSEPVAGTHSPRADHSRRFGAVPRLWGTMSWSRRTVTECRVDAGGGDLPDERT